MTRLADVEAEHDSSMHDAQRSGASFAELAELEAEHAAELAEAEEENRLREKIIDCLTWLLDQDEIDVSTPDEAVDLYLEQNRA